MDTPEEKPISALYGVGAAREAQYGHLGIHTIGDLLLHYPRAYENRGDVHTLLEACRQSDQKTAVVLTVGSEPRLYQIRKGMVLLKFRAFDDSGSCEITYFNQNYLKDAFVLGGMYRFYGKVQSARSALTMSNPAYEEVPGEDPTQLPDLLPIYPTTQGLSQKQIKMHVSLALRLAALGRSDPLPEDLRIERKLCTGAYALQQIHNPESLQALAAAKRRLVYEEFFLFALGLSLTRNRIRAGVATACLQSNLSQLTALLPYPLTHDQRKAIEEVRADMAKTLPMSRMIVGDVGCGKTVCAAAAMLFAVQSGLQAALMAPTEILARQHAQSLGEWFEALHIRYALLIGATPAAEKRRIKAALAETDPSKRLQVVIGTQALLSDGVEFSAPGLVVTDEQHRFGVAQRAVFSQKSHLSHLLVMSATPIPRTLALGLYGDLDISRIEEMPPGRQIVDTFVVDTGYHARLCAFMKKLTADGGQVYVVCPAIESAKIDPDSGEEDDRLVSLEEVPLSCESGELFAPSVATEKDSMVSAVEYAQTLACELAPLRVGCLHGKMKPAEKDTVMEQFTRGEIQVLVSTTVIEVGVNVPNACLMVVENADRFGLSQLHQLRGRVGRGKRKSYCVLVKSSAKVGEAAERRLEVMRTTHDGFEIASQDLLARGPGDFLRSANDEGEEAGKGVRQSGSLHLRLADACRDTDLMQTAFADAKKLLATDAELMQNPILAARLRGLFSLDQSILN